MTTFSARVRAELDRHVRAIAAETGDLGHLQHRRLAERVKALVASWRFTADPAPLAQALRLTELLRARQGPSGLFHGGDNVDSPPDSAFSVNDLADTALLLRDAPDGPARELADALGELLAAVTPALVKGGVHTPNHRWELSAALARLHRLEPRAALAERVGQWLAEGVDIDADGLYSERSANYAAHVSNPSLLTIADVFDRPDLIDAVERNLDATLDLILPDGTVETVLSRRQDQGRAMPLYAYQLPLRAVALLRGRGDLAWAARLAEEPGLASPGDAATALLLDPGLGRELPEPVAPARPRQRHFAGAGLLVRHGPATTAVLFGGSDYARHRRVRSGLSNTPTFLRLFGGDVVLDSVRLSRTFFGLGPFRADGLTVAPGPVVTLSETVTGAYYQPLAPPDRDAGGVYALGDEGRFSAAMDFGRRARDEVVLVTTVRAGLTGTGVELTVDIRGAAVDWALELAFRPGGAMTGAADLGGGRWLLEAGPARYRVGDDALEVTVAERFPAVDSDVGAVYHPGEDYEFLGGTDAAGGELLYVTGKAPVRLRLGISLLRT